MMRPVKRFFIAALSLWMSLSALHAANVVTVGGAQGEPGQQATVSVGLTVDAADVAAVEIRIPLPDGIEPVEGSLTLNAARVPDHSVTAGMNGRDYVIVVFNTSLKALPVGTGELLSFKLALGENPGSFSLTPQVKLGAADGSPIVAETSGGTLSVLAPRLELGVSEIDFGRVPLLSEETRQVEVRNTGTTTLSISDFTTGVEGLTAVMPATVSAGESAWIELHYSPTVRSANVDGRFIPVSDGVGRPPFVRIRAVPFSVNELHIGNATGISDEEVTVSVAMNNMEPITGAEFSLQLPDELEFVEGSATKGSRASSLSVESYVRSDRKLRIVLFGLSNKAVEGNDGELLTFRLKLKGRTGYYSLYPVNTILANASGENMVSEVFGGGVTISSPRLSANSDWAIGNVPLSGPDTFTYTVMSEGEVPLTVEKVAFLNDIAECVTEMPLVVAPYEQKEISVRMKKPQFGEFATTMNLYTNDPDNRMKSVSVTGNFYSPNEMSFAGRYADGKYLIDASLTNEEAIAALQLDVVCPAGISTDESLLKLAARAESHSATLAKVDANRYRIVIFSLKNTPLAGNEGVVFSLGLEGESLAGSQIRVENIKLSSVDGVNITTPDTDVKIGTLPEPLTGIILSPETATMKAGDELQLSVSFVPEGAEAAELEWKSSDETVATVSATGLVTAVSIGTATITATSSSGLTAECVVTVATTPVESISLNLSELSLKVGESATLTATVLPETATDKTLIWTVADESFATVMDGVVSAQKLGRTTVTVTAADGSGISAECTVNVVLTAVESIILDKNSSELKVGETVQLSATVAPDNATDKSVVWSSSDEAVATVSATGLVTAVSVGTATITATSSSGLTAECVVTVAAPPVESISLNLSELSLKVGESATLTATVLPETATDKTLIWTVADESVATVMDGVVSAQKLGSTTVTVTAADGSGISAECTVNVVLTAVESIILDKNSSELKVGETVQLSATVAPDNATDKSVVWSSSDDAVATVSATGLVTAVSVGTTTITATSSSGLTAECVVTVAAPLAVSIEVSPAEIVAIPGKTFALEVKITSEEAANQLLVWKSSDPGIATVSQEGVVEIINVGSAVITVSTTDGSALSATCRVTGVSGLEEAFADPDMKADIYNIRGLLLMRNATQSDFQRLPAGIYIIKGKKIIKI